MISFALMRNYQRCKKKEKAMKKIRQIEGKENKNVSLISSLFTHLASESYFVAAL
jgi:hypothetical protein